MKTIRENIIYFLFWLISMIAAFQFGIIWEMKGLDSIKKRLNQIEERQTKMTGDIESHQVMLRGIGKGRMPQIP